MSGSEDIVQVQPRRRVELREDSSWCQSIFCGRRKTRRILSQFVDSSRTNEAHNAECVRVIEELNSSLALFREQLVQVARPQDCPEVRERIRDSRRKCLDLCVAACDLLMPHIKSDVAEGIPVDSQQLVNLFCCTQFLLREIKKCQHLVRNNFMDMTAHYEKKPRTSGMSVLDKLVLFKIPPRDYHQEELQSIQRDTENATALLKEMKEFMPCESNDKFFMDENFLRWNKKTRKTACKFAEEWICYCGTNLA